MRKAALLLLLVGCADEAPDPEPSDAGSLCACREIDGARECCFGHGVCEPQASGPDLCVCDPGAQGDTCSTPPPGIHAVRARACEGDDPGCHHEHAFVGVETFDECVDLDGESFTSIIVRPAIDGDGGWPADSLPVAILTHGASMHPADYYDLLEHVAANGIVIAAFDASVGGDVTFRANRLLSYLECLRLTWDAASHLTDRYALIGHSRGGAAVAVAAKAIDDGLAASGVEVEAVVALAPSLTGQFPLPSAATPSYFTLQGSRDPDTQGASLGWFDEAGEGDPNFVRALAWIEGATHQRFHQGLLFADSGEFEASLSAEGHWTVARAYVGGFVIWRLLLHDVYRRFFVGEAVPASVAAARGGPPGVHAGLTDGTTARLLVHDFELDALTPSNVGGLVEAIDVDVMVGPLAELDAPWSSPHRSNGARLDWAAGAQPVLRFELPAGSQDLSSFAALSVRVARVFDGANDCGEPEPFDDVALVLRDDQSEVTVPLDVPPADRFVPTHFGNWASAACHAQDALVAQRIPMQAFCDGGLDVTGVTAIELRIHAGGGGSSGGGLLIDDLALERGEGEAAGCP